MRIALAVAVLMSFPQIGVLAQDAQDHGQNEEEFSAWMEAATQNVGRLLLRVQAKEAEDAKLAAAELQRTFAQVSDFFQAKNVSSAAQYAADARDGFRKVEELVTSGDMTAAYQTVQATRANCENCHRDHRERGPDGGYRIKY